MRHNKEEIRLAVSVPVPEDAAEIQQIFYKTWLATYPNEEAGISKDDIEDFWHDKMTEGSLKKRAEAIANISPKEKMLIAKIDNKIVGLCRVTKTGEMNNLQALYVLPEYHGMGIGRKLWDSMADFLDPAKDTDLWVATYNKNAIAFYQKLGFVDSGKRLSEERFKMKSGAIIPEMEMIIKSQNK